MTRRYVIALLLIAAVLILSHTLLLAQIARTESDGYIINVSGMQRMLSQRIGLMAIELTRNDDLETSSALAAKLEDAHSMMKSNQSELNQANEQSMTPEIQDLYYGQSNLDQRVTDYLSLAEQLLNQHQQQPDQKEQQKQTAQKIVEVARNGLLDELDAVVTQYQKEYEQRIVLFRRAQLAFLAIGLFLLAIEAAFIFRPMTQNVSRTMSSLEDANAELREFAYRISHDLRAPVASSIGLSQMISDSLKEGDTDFAAQGIGRVQGAMKKLDELIGDIITVTKNRHLEVEPELVDVGLMINEILESQSHLPGFERLDIEKDIDRDAFVATKRIMLSQTLENLISNAIKYSDPDKSSPKLKVKASVQDGQMRIEVADNGIGFPIESQDQMFGMFKRFHPRQSFGSGLGLYLVKQNVDAMHGTIRYTPLSEGSSFVIQVPQLSTGVLS
ncbi:sensor histidine kinase [Rubripirellula obstinata]|nr:ATP-binding protein [Rubripirellula obstinata]